MFTLFLKWLMALTMPLISELDLHHSILYCSSSYSFIMCTTLGRGRRIILNLFIQTFNISQCQDIRNLSLTYAIFHVLFSSWIPFQHKRCSEWQASLHSLCLVSCAQPSWHWVLFPPCPLLFYLIMQMETFCSYWCPLCHSYQRQG